MDGGPGDRRSGVPPAGLEQQIAPRDLQLAAQEGPELAGMIPADDVIYEFDLNGRPTIHMPDDCVSIKAAVEIFDKIIE